MFYQTPTTYITQVHTILVKEQPLSHTSYTPPSTQGSAIAPYYSSACNIALHYTPLLVASTRPYLLPHTLLSGWETRQG